MVYNNDKWKLITKENAINNLYDKKRNFIEAYIEDNGELITEKRLEALNRWLNTDESHNRIKQIKEDMKLVLYNNKDMIMNTKNRIE